MWRADVMRCAPRSIAFLCAAWFHVHLPFLDGAQIWISRVFDPLLFLVVQAVWTLGGVIVLYSRYETNLEMSRALATIGETQGESSGNLPLFCFSRFVCGFKFGFAVLRLFLLCLRSWKPFALISR